MPGPPQLRTLTSLRFFAAFSVLAFHLLPYVMGVRYASLPEILTRLLESGYASVTFFFVLSGFVLYHAYRTRIPRGAAEIGTYLGRRFARLAPMFYLSLLLGAGALRLANSRIGPGRLALDGLLNVSFLAAWVPRSLFLNYPSWSISVEALCYLVFPFFLPFLVRLRRGQAWGVLCLAFAVSASMQLAALALYPGLWRWPWAPGSVNPSVPEFLSVNPLVHFPSFVYGAALARLHEASPPREGSRADLSMLGGGFVALALLELGPHWPSLTTTTFLLLPCHALVLFGGASARSACFRWLEAPWLVLLGESSYVLYVVHVPAYNLWQSWLPAASPWVTGAGFFLGLPLVSVFLHLWVEVPARGFLNRRFAGAPG